jgi:hypothetical protein
MPKSPKKVKKPKIKEQKVKEPVLEKEIKVKAIPEDFDSIFERKRAG